MWKTKSNLIVKYLYIHLNINRKIQKNEVITQEKVKIIASKIPRICSEVLFNVHISHLQVKFIWNCQEGTNEKKDQFYHTYIKLFKKLLDCFFMLFDGHPLRIKFWY